MCFETPMSESEVTAKASSRAAAADLELPSTGATPDMYLMSTSLFKGVIYEHGSQ